MEKTALLLALLLSACGGRDVRDDCADLAFELQSPAGMLRVDTVHAVVGQAAELDLRQRLEVSAPNAYYFHVTVVFSELARAAWETKGAWSMTPAPVDVGAHRMTIEVKRDGSTVETREVALCVTTRRTLD